MLSVSLLYIPQPFISVPHHPRQPVAHPKTMTLPVTTYPIFLETNSVQKWGGEEEEQKETNEKRAFLCCLTKISYPGTATWRQVRYPTPSPLSQVQKHPRVLRILKQSPHV